MADQNLNTQVPGGDPDDPGIGFQGNLAPGGEQRPPQTLPADELASAGAVDQEVERVMMEEMARAEAEQATLAQMDRPTVQSVEFDRFQRTDAAGAPRNIAILMDVKLPVSIELGRTEMSIREILELGSGSVVELSKLAGEPVDLLVNNKIIARGEVVVVDENFGLRVTSLISPEDRLKSL